MANQVEATKVVAYVGTGSDSDEAVSSKVVAYFIVIPGEAAADSTAQGHVYCQILRRD